MDDAMDIGAPMFETASVRQIGSHLIRQLQINDDFDLLGAI
jgi:hypothetical protein